VYYYKANVCSTDVKVFHASEGRRGFCENSNELSDSIKGGELLDHLSNYKLMKKDYVPWN
jgi:hypothetical protein